MKEQDKMPGQKLIEGETGNLPEKEFGVMIEKIIQDLRKRMEAQIEKMQEMFNKNLELENKEIKITEMKKYPRSNQWSNRHKNGWVSQKAEWWS